MVVYARHPQANLTCNALEERGPKTIWNEIEDIEDESGKKNAYPIFSANSPCEKMERVNGLEPSTYTLARYRSSQLSYTRILKEKTKL